MYGLVGWVSFVLFNSVGSCFSFILLWACWFVLALLGCCFTLRCGGWACLRVLDLLVLVGRCAGRVWGLLMW